MTLDDCGSGCGIIAALIGVVGFGSFGAPPKSEGKKNHYPSPFTVVFYFYLHVLTGTLPLEIDTSILISFMYCIHFTENFAVLLMLTLLTFFNVENLHFSL